MGADGSPLRAALAAVLVCHMMWLCSAVAADDKDAEYSNCLNSNAFIAACKAKAVGYQQPWDERACGATPTCCPSTILMHLSRAQVDCAAP